MSFEHVQVGDTVTRMLAGTVPMELDVSQVTEDRIICGPWEFDRITGIEIDDEIDCIVSHLIHAEK